jgi:hypothetical protein
MRIRIRSETYADPQHWYPPKCIGSLGTIVFSVCSKLSDFLISDFDWGDKKTTVLCQRYLLNSYKSLNSYLYNYYKSVNNVRAVYILLNISITNKILWIQSKPFDPGFEL